MRISTNTKLIQRRRRIAGYASFSGLGFLIVSLVTSFVNGGDHIQNIALAYIAIIVGMILAFIGSALAHKWVREPRADNALARALKGFDNKHHLYNYLLPAAHVLLSPSGITVFRVKPLDGDILCENDKWKRARRWTRILGRMGEEPMGNPTEELRIEIERMRKFLASGFDRAPLVPLSGYIVFSDPNARLTAQNPSVPVVHADDLKDTYRKTRRAPPLAPQLYDDLETILNKYANEKATH